MQESFSVGTDTEGLFGLTDQQATPSGVQTTPLHAGPDALLGSPTRAEQSPLAAGVPPVAPVAPGTGSSPALNAAPPDDRVILREHEDALRKLEALQKEMIGGEKAGMWYGIMRMDLWFA